MVIFYRIKRKINKIISSFIWDLHKVNVCSIRKAVFAAISSPEVGTVSFDVFDTLVVRPVINPTDVFSLLADRVYKEYGFDILSLRLNAEKSIKKSHITLSDIYEYIQSVSNISAEILEKIRSLELTLESQLLSARKDVKDFYDMAVSKGKRIIAVSDMYLPSDFILEVLKSKGYDRIEKVYVSCEHNARKDEGKLFDIVQKDYSTESIIHIGDNYISDYRIPKRKRIFAFYYPPVINLVAAVNPYVRNMIYKTAVVQEEKLVGNVFLGYTINYFWNKNYGMPKKTFSCLESIVELFLAPYLAYIALFLQRNHFIQQNYKQIYFVARDGYLPQKIYDCFSRGKNYLASSYLYGSRIAYWTGIYGSFETALYAAKKTVTSDYTFANFLDLYVWNKEKNNDIKNRLSDNELNYLIVFQTQQCIAVLQREKHFFTECYNNQKEIASEYYKSWFKSEAERVIVFDIGYSGTVSFGISNLADKKVDKIYLSETEKNIWQDYRTSTYTYLLKEGAESHINPWKDLICELVFSPPQGTCLGFERDESGEVVPIFKNKDFSDAAKVMLNDIESECINYANCLNNNFGEFIHNLNIPSIYPLIEMWHKIFKKNSRMRKMFDDIEFDNQSCSSKNKLFSKILKNAL